MKILNNINGALTEIGEMAQVVFRRPPALNSSTYYGPRISSGW